jgi:transcriptional regulator with XRE-family HTH domain
MYRMAPATSLRQIREGLKVTQEDVARRTDLGLRTYVRAENGSRITYGTATQILEAINELLAEQSKEPVVMEDLGLALY